MDENVYLEVSCSGGHLASGQSAEHIIFQAKTKAKDFGAHRKRLNPASEVVIALSAAGDDQLISHTGRGLTIGIQICCLRIRKSAEKQYAYVNCIAKSLN